MWVHASTLLMPRGSLQSGTGPSFSHPVGAARDGRAWTARLAPWPDSLAGLLERPFVTPPRILGLLALNLPLLAKEEMSVVCGPGSGPQGQTSGNSWAMMHLPSNLISIMLGRKNTWGC